MLEKLIVVIPSIKSVCKFELALGCACDDAQKRFSDTLVYPIFCRLIRKRLAIICRQIMMKQSMPFAALVTALGLIDDILLL